MTTEKIHTRLVFLGSSTHVLTYIIAILSIIWASYQTIISCWVCWSYHFPLIILRWLDWYIVRVWSRTILSGYELVRMLWLFVTQITTIQSMLQSFRHLQIRFIRLLETHRLESFLRLVIINLELFISEIITQKWLLHFRGHTRFTIVFIWEDLRACLSSRNGDSIWKTCSWKNATLSFDTLLQFLLLLIFKFNSCFFLFFKLFLSYSIKLFHLLEFLRHFSSILSKLLHYKLLN